MNQTKHLMLKIKQARVHNKLRFMNSPKGSLMEDYLPIINDSLNF